MIIIQPVTDLAMKRKKRKYNNLEEELSGMPGFDIFRRYGHELEKRIRFKTFPLAVKLLESGINIPRGAERPLRDWGYHVPVCQGYTLSRKEGKTVAMFKEDMWCFEPVVGYGWAEPPQYFLEGHNRFPEDVNGVRLN